MTEKKQEGGKIDWMSLIALGMATINSFKLTGADLKLADAEADMNFAEYQKLLALQRLDRLNSYQPYEGENASDIVRSHYGWKEYSQGLKEAETKVNLTKAYNAMKAKQSKSDALGNLLGTAGNMAINYFVSKGSNNLTSNSSTNTSTSTNFSAPTTLNGKPN